MEALKGIPEVEAPLLTEQGEARLTEDRYFQTHYVVWI
jgi:hypothetical protein